MWLIIPYNQVIKIPKPSQKNKMVRLNTYGVQSINIALPEWRLSAYSGLFTFTPPALLGSQYGIKYSKISR